MTTAGLVLAAGEGKRFGGPKAPYVHNGQRLVDRAVQVLAEAGCDPVFVVLGAWLGEVPNATVLENQNWKSGMGSSLQVGLATLNGESEIDEVQFDYIFSKSVVFTFFSTDNPFFKQFLEGVKGRKLHLYDLYCNWKIHLS